MIRTAILGAVRHAVDYAIEFDEHPRFSLVAVADDVDQKDWRWDRACELARAYVVPCLSWEDLLDRDDVDLVLITSEPTRHAALSIKALEAGMSILVDKPVATTADDARALAMAAARDGVTSTYVHRLFSPPIVRLRSFVERGALGVPRTLHLTWISGNAIEDEGGEIIVDPALSGGGELWNFLGYPLDAIHALTGLEVRNVMTSTTSATGPRHREFGVESLAVVSLELEANVLATIVVGRSPLVGDLSTITVVGSHGYATIDEGRPAIERLGVGRQLSSMPVRDSFTSSFRSLLDDLANAFEMGARPLQSVREGCAVAETIARAVECSPGRNKDAPTRARLR